MPRELQLSLGLSDEQARRVAEAAEEDGESVTQLLQHAVNDYVGFRDFTLRSGAQW